MRGKVRILLILILGAALILWSYTVRESLTRIEAFLDKGEKQQARFAQLLKLWDAQLKERENQLAEYNRLKQEAVDYNDARMEDYQKMKDEASRDYEQLKREVMQYNQEQLQKLEQLKQGQ